MSPPKWIKPQLCKLAAKAPSGPLWVHEIKFDGYRIAARIDHGAVQLLTRSGLDWTVKYPATAAALAKLKVKSAYLDGELCGVRPDGVTSFALMQQASDRGGAGLVYFAFDLLELDGEDLAALPLLDRKTRLASSPAGRGVEIGLDLGFEGRLIALERQQIIGLVGDDLVGDVDLTAHGIDGDERAFELLGFGELIEQVRDGGDLVGLFGHA